MVSQARSGIEKSIESYLRANAIKLSKIARETGITYQYLYDSLMHKSKFRELRSSELIAVCQVLGKTVDFFVEER